MTTKLYKTNPPPRPKWAGKPRSFPGSKKPISDDTVRAIRKATGEAIDIAKRFGVSTAYVGRVKRKQLRAGVSD